ncbi:MAG: hypothetical protein ACYCYM_00825 [Saccharofermentanales bacterium]
MMLDKAIVTVFSIILIIALCVNVIGMILVVAQKINFDNICKNALFQIDIDGGLSEQNRQDLISRLTRSGFDDIVIEGPEAVQYGDWIYFSVKVRIKTQNWNGLFQLNTEYAEITYERQIISRKIHNSAY